MEEIIKNREEIIKSIKKNFAENNGRRAMNIVRLHKDMLDDLWFCDGDPDVDLVVYIEYLYYMENSVADKCLQDILEALALKAGALDIYDKAQKAIRDALSNNKIALLKKENLD